MGKNIKGGKNYKRQKRNTSERELVFREDEQLYARIIKQYGDGRFECQIFNTDSIKTIVGKISGSLRNKIWIKPCDIVLVSLRNFDTSNCDIIHKYTDEEVYILKEYNELPSNINLMATEIELSEGKLYDDEQIEFTLDCI